LAEIKSEVTFGIDNFGEPASMSQADTIAQMIVNLLLLRPGQLPSLPHIGINVRQYLYKFEEDISTADIKNKISNQCAELLAYIDVNSMQVILLPYKNESILYFFIPLSVKVAENTAISIGFKRNTITNNITYNYTINNILD